MNRRSAIGRMFGAAAGLAAGMLGFGAKAKEAKQLSGEGPQIRDLSGNGNHGTPRWVARGPFLGTASYVDGNGKRQVYSPVFKGEYYLISMEC